MDAKERIRGKKVLIVDDEKDVLDTLIDFLGMCKIDTALSFDEAKELLKYNDYDVAILDIMGVRGFDLLEITRKKKIPTLMLTAHGLSEENLKRSVEEGASYYAPKEKMSQIDVFVADVLEAEIQKKSAWEKVFYRLGSYYDKLFGGTDWREKEKDFWNRKFKELSGL